MTGPYHYKRAEEILAEVEAADAVPDGTETALAIRAQAHALLALAAATAIDPGGFPPRRARHSTAADHGQDPAPQPAHRDAVRPPRCRSRR
jgi:hypothetical protein